MRWVALFCVLLLSACGGSTAPTPAAVIAAFQAAGLEATDVAPMDAAAYGLAPKVCDGVRFLIPSLGGRNGGRVFVCSDSRDRDALKAYYDSLGKSSAAFFSWVFVKGDVLVQINGTLPEAQARKYEAALP